LAFFTLAATIAERRPSIPSPLDASACGLAWMRTAGRCPPDSVTRPTPGTCDSFCAKRVSARFWTCGNGSDAEVSARVTIGASAGLTLL
jgi:hypothetical protein